MSSAPPYLQTDTVIEISIGNNRHSVDVSIPRDAQGIVLFVDDAPGRAMSHHTGVADAIQRAGMATLRFDLAFTTEEPNEDRIERLTDRLVSVTDWARQRPAFERLPLGYFAVGTGAALALRGAAARPLAVRALVIRGGRPDLAQPDLPQVHAPTLIIAGANDPSIDFQRKAFKTLTAAKHLEVIPNASHQFEEPGAPERVAQLAANWFQDHLHVYSPAELDGLATVPGNEDRPGSRPRT